MGQYGKMNRAERRRLEKAKAKVHIFTHDDMMFQKGFDAGIKEGLRKESGMTTRLFTTSMAAVLHDEFGFGKQRLERVLAHVSATLEATEDNLEHEKKMRDWIKKECDIDLDDYTGGRTIELRDELQKMYNMGKMVGVIDKDVFNEETE